MNTRLFLVPLALVAVVACSKTRSEDEKSAQATLTSTSWVTNESAINRIVASRCAREVTCSNLGPDKHFTTADLCVREVKEKVSTDLGTTKCPSGIDGKELDECLDAIRNESCTNALETLERLAACRAGGLCLKR